MAIALDGGYPDDTFPGGFAGQQHLTPFGRRRLQQAEYLFSLTDPRLRISARIAASGAASDVPQPHNQPDLNEPATHAAYASDIDSKLVGESFLRIAQNGGAVMEYFYARLFVQYPEMRSMFPHAMHEHMERVFTAIARIVWSMDNPDSLAEYLSQLGRGHRKFGVRDRHYEPFLAVLSETVRHFSGESWTCRTQAAWDAALGRAASVMRAAAERDAERQPSWWVGEVVQHDLRRPDLAVLTIRPDQPLHYLPGQYLAVQVPRWPRVWRNFSIANAPRENGLIDLHVRGVCGGMVSGSLVRGTHPGDTLLLGPACGEMTASDDADAALLCVAGGTGLAPIKAIIEGVINSSRPGRRREIVLYFGARSEEDLYDLADLRVLEWIYPPLTVFPVVSGQQEFDGIKGMLPEIVAQHANCEGREIFVSGPDEMVRKTAELLAGRVGPGQIRHDPPDPAR
jgi:NAD(P)H-flavin reductase/hemoglobin-like flavoprotein